MMTENFSWFLNWIKNPKRILLSVFFLLILCGKFPKDDRSDNELSVSKRYLKLNDKDSIKVYWDAVQNYFDTVESYNLYYHTLSDTEWKILKGQIPQSDSPRITIKRNEILSDDSILFFGVTSITLEGAESNLHSCEDSTADPPNWAAIWNRR